MWGESWASESVWGGRGAREWGENVCWDESGARESVWGENGTQESVCGVRVGRAREKECVG